MGDEEAEREKGAQRRQEVLTWILSCPFFEYQNQLNAGGGGAGRAVGEGRELVDV